jgi:hypothetical protein
MFSVVWAILGVLELFLVFIRLTFPHLLFSEYCGFIQREIT